VTTRPPNELELLLSPASQPASLLAFRETREGPASGDGLFDGQVQRARVLIGGVGYTCLSDLSVGPLLIEQLRAQDWPPGVVVEDLSYGPIDVLYRLQASPPFSAAIFTTAVGRGRTPGTLYRGRWAAPSLPPDELQTRIAEAITGVISLDNLLHILAHFGALPPEVVTLEVEPLHETWGEELSMPVQAALSEAACVARAEVERLLAAGSAP
jgi:hydrogenase maturation protease